MSLTRADIHKGALGLEQIAACFHELAGVADTVVTAQRKLSRALKEGASSKGCPEFAKRAFNASACILDVLSESDASYARTIEREYEILSADLRKWFKRLAKDERDHDGYVTARESRIRQAGEAYERRALKKDIAGEYARYVELLNTLGAEIASAQHQHMDEVNVRHATIMTSSGACLARVADASWARTCEAIRRCAPGIGRLGEARAWCESGWHDSCPEPVVTSDISLAGQPVTTGASRPFPEPLRPPSDPVFTPSIVSPVATRSPTGQNTEPMASSPPSPLANHSHGNRTVQASTQSDLYSDYYTGVTDPASVVDQSAPQDAFKDHPADSERDHPVLPASNFSEQDQDQSAMMGGSNRVVEDHIATRRRRSSNRNISSREAIFPSRQTPSPLHSTQPRVHIMAARTRPVTPNSLSPRSPSWVGKGLRRFSMPSFTSNR